MIFLLIVTIGPYLAFTKHVPFTSYGYELNATFANGVNISTNSPVRIAGVDVGKVLGAERDGDATKVSFTVGEDGRPIHDDAFAQIRPRIFLEGNFFIDLDPGSPSAPEMDSGDTIPVSHTSTAVQFDEILTALQSPVRADLGRLLEGFGTALNATPTAAEDATQLPEVQGKSGGEALNGALDYGGDAGRYGAQVTEAFLGTEPHDLSRLIAGAGRTFGAFARHEGDLQDLIVNFEVFTGALAAQSENLGGTIHQFAPTLKHGADLAGQPQPDAAAAARLGDRVQPGGRRAARPDRRRETVARAGPAAALRQGGRRHRQAARRSHPGPRRRRPGGQGRSPCRSSTGSASARSKVLLPTGNQTIDDRFSTGEPNYREFFYTLTNFAGESQNFDGNGPYLRLQPGGGDMLVGEPNPNGNLTTDKTGWAYTSTPPLGTQPQLRAGRRRSPDVRCDTQPVPDLNGRPRPGRRPDPAR